MNSVEEICEEVAIINHSKKILQGSINEIKKKYEENLWTILYSGNQINFTNAVWGERELMKNMKVNENINKEEIKLLNDYTINKFIKGIIDQVEVLDINKKIPNSNDVFITTTNER